MGRLQSIRGLSAFCAVLYALFSPGLAWADYALLVVIGKDSPTKELVRSRGEEYLQKVGFEVMSERSAREVGTSAKDIERCLNAEEDCMQKALVTAQVDRLLAFELREVPGEGLVIMGRLFDGFSGKRIRTDQRRCDDACRQSSRLGELIDDLAGALLGIQVQTTQPARVAAPGEGLVEIVTTPPGGMVSIDGKEVGPSGRSYSVAPGKHTVRVHALGYVPAEQEIEVAEKETKRVELLLMRESGSLEDSGPSAMPWVALGSGVALVGLGVVGIAVGERPRFDDAGNRQEKMWDTRYHGIGALAVGAALIGWSGYKLFTDSATGSEAQLVLVPASGAGLGLGIAGSL